MSQVSYKTIFLISGLLIFQMPEANTQPILDAEGGIKIGFDGNIGVDGEIRYNSQNNKFEFHQGNQWVTFNQYESKQLNIPGISFLPLEMGGTSNNYYTYDSLGRGGSAPLVAPVVLPSGSIIDSLTFFFNPSLSFVSLKFIEQNIATGIDNILANYSGTTSQVTIVEETMAVNETIKHESIYRVQFENAFPTSTIQAVRFYYRE